MRVKVLVGSECKQSYQFLSEALCEKPVTLHFCHFGELGDTLNQGRDCYNVILLLPLQCDQTFFQLVHCLAHQDPCTPVMVAALPDDVAVLLPCFQAGAKNCSVVTETIDELWRKLQGTVKGLAYLSPEVAFQLLRRLAAFSALSRRSGLRPLASNRWLVHVLTEREYETLLYLEQGLSNAEIADCMVIGVGTVKTHVHKIFKKLGVENRKAAAYLAYQCRALDSQQ